MSWWVYVPLKTPAFAGRTAPTLPLGEGCSPDVRTGAWIHRRKQAELLTDEGHSEEVRLGFKGLGQAGWGRRGGGNREAIGGGAAGAQERPPPRGRRPWNKAGERSERRFLGTGLA